VSAETAADTDGWDTTSSSAAAVTEPVRTTARKLRSCVIVTAIWLRVLADSSVDVYVDAKGALMAGLTRAQVREAVERAGDDHWQALIRHHEEAYPASRPTPGDVCRAEAERLNQLGLGDAEELRLVETRVERTDSTVRLVHLFEYGPQKARLLTEAFEGYGGEEGEEP
jgi:hypothetical protein